MHARSMCFVAKAGVADELVFNAVRVPAANLLAQEGDGFRMAHARLGPGPSTTRCARSAWPSAPWR